MRDIQLCVMQGYLPGAHHRVELVLYLVFGVGDFPASTQKFFMSLLPPSSSGTRWSKFAADVAAWAVSPVSVLVLLALFGLA